MLQEVTQLQVTLRRLQSSCDEGAADLAEARQRVQQAEEAQYAARQQAEAAQTAVSLQLEPLQQVLLTCWPYASSCMLARELFHQVTCSIEWVSNV